MTLVAGSYEKFIWGFSLKTLKPNPAIDEEPPEPTTANKALALKPLFSYPSHTAPIKCCAVSGPVAVSGGADDSIKVYDLPSSSEVGSLIAHGGAVTALAFYMSPALHFPRNLIAGSDDGSVSIYDADPFVHLKSVKVHKKGIVDVAVHPSGRLAITVGRDACFAMVNLVRGRRSFCCKLNREAGVVRYGLGDGERFFMAEEERVTVHDSEDARIVAEIDAKKVLCLAPGESGLLFTGGEDRCVTAWDTSSGKSAYCIEDAHPARIKGIVILGSRSTSQASDAPYLLASASSDGIIRVWDIRMVAKEKPSPLAEANTRSRLTCLAGASIKCEFFFHFHLYLIFFLIPK